MDEISVTSDWIHVYICVQMTRWCTDSFSAHSTFDLQPRIDSLLGQPLALELPIDFWINVNTGLITNRKGRFNDNH